MGTAALAQMAEGYLQRLCAAFIDRRVGSPGNRAATDFVGERLAKLGFEIDAPSFDCIDWCQGGARLTANNTQLEVFVSPYSRGGYARAPLTVCSTLEALESAAADDTVLLMRGALAQEPLMPKRFPFYNPEPHQRIIHLLETKNPRAIVAATSRNPDLAGAVYPFPLIEDGDFDIPSVFTTREEGDRLAACAGEVISLDIRALRSPAQGCNVVARKGSGPGRRMVLLAHIDTKDGTPGALDNAGGVVVLLLLAELLKGYAGELIVELVAVNGEDYFSSPGQQLFLRTNAGRFEEIVLGVNLDGAGYRRGRTAYSRYDCPSDLTGIIDGVFSAHPGLVEGEPWYQGDHGLFLMHDVPAVAMTSERMMDVLSDIAHTSRDTPAMVDVGTLVDAALALHDLALRLDEIAL